MAVTPILSAPRFSLPAILGAPARHHVAGPPVTKIRRFLLLPALVSLPALIVVIAGAAPIAAARMPRGAALAPHQAIYTLSLNTLRAPGKVTDADGSMFLEIAESCGRWQTQQRIRLRISDRRGRNTDITTSFTSSEAKDGLTYRFTSQTKRDGKIAEDVRGRASLSRRGGAGVAVFSRPRPRRIPLPKGTLFPTAHMRLLINSAEAGKTLVWRTVFDGATDDGPYEVNALIARRAAANAVPLKTPLANRPFWPMRIAYFSTDSSAAEPTFEISSGVQDNGVARTMTLDYGDFTLEATLAAIRELPTPRCAK